MGLEGGEGRATPHAGREGGGVFGPCREGFVGFIWEPTEEHGEAMAGGRSHIMPCPGTGVDGNPNYGLKRKGQPSLGYWEGCSGELQIQCPGLTQLWMDQHQSMDQHLFD